MANEPETGPVYGVELIRSLPLSDTGRSSMHQAMPSRDDLVQVREINERVVAGYEVLLSHFQRSEEENQTLRQVLAHVPSNVAIRAQEDAGFGNLAKLA